MEAKKVLRHFMAAGQSYGEGECLMWEHQVDVKKLLISSKVLLNKHFKGKDIALADLILWKKFNISYLGVIPQAGFSVKLSWRQFLVLVL